MSKQNYDKILHMLRNLWQSARVEYKKNKTVPTNFIQSLEEQIRNLKSELEPDDTLRELTPEKFFLQEIANINNAQSFTEIVLAISVYFALHDQSRGFSEDNGILRSLLKRHWELQCELYKEAQLKVRADAMTNGWIMYGLDWCLFYMCTYSGDLSSTGYGTLRLLFQGMTNAITRATTRSQLPGEMECLELFKIRLLACLLTTEESSLQDSIATLQAKNLELQQKINFFKASARCYGFGRGMVDWFVPVPPSTSLLQTFGFFSVRKYAGNLIDKVENFCLGQMARAFTEPDHISTSHR